MELQLAGKTAVITGGSKGIGKGIADVLAAEGVNLHLASRTAAELEAAQADIKSRHDVSVEIHPLDLSKSENCRTLAQESGILDGTVDILVNNAGAIPGGAITTVQEDAWREAWDLKVFGFVNLCRLAYPALKARGGGVIFNIVGTGGVRPAMNYICGSTANAGLIAFTQAMGQMSLEDNVRVLGVAPGHVQTERLERQTRLKAKESLGSADRWREMLDFLPQKRPATVPEIADVVAFLLSPRAYWVNGVVLTVDGGAYLRS